MKDLLEIQILLGNKSFVIENKLDLLKFVLKISPYLPSNSKKALTSILEQSEYELPIYLRFKSNPSFPLYYDGWSKMKNYNKYNNPDLIERIDDLIPYLELL